MAAPPSEAVGADAPANDETSDIVFKHQEDDGYSRHADNNQPTFTTLAWQSRLIVRRLRTQLDLKIPGAETPGKLLMSSVGAEGVGAPRHNVARSLALEGIRQPSQRRNL